MQDYKIIFLFFFISLSASGQTDKKMDYTWALGYDKSGIDSNFGGNNLNFLRKLNQKYSNRIHEIIYQSASYCDLKGNILYHSNGCAIYDDQNRLISNGDSISFGKLWGSCPLYNAENQNSYFLKVMDNDSLIVYIKGIFDTIGEGKQFYRKGLQENIIDHTNKSLIVKNRMILYDTLAGEGFSVLPAFAKNEYWLITPQLGNNRIWILYYTINGIKSAIEQSIGFPQHPDNSGNGQGCFSMDGKKYAHYNTANGLQIFDFDRANGVLSNAKYLPLKNYDRAYGGCCFSPNSKYLYINTPLEVLQIDVENPSMECLDTVGKFDNFYDPYPTTYFHMAHAPDCRIYISCPSGNQFFHVILYPNRKGKACQLVNRGLKLLTRNGDATPLFPHYRIDEAYPCDSSILLDVNWTTDLQDIQLNYPIHVYPNPTQDQVNFDLGDHYFKGLILFYDLLGNEKKRVRLTEAMNQFQIDLSSLENGIYYYSLWDEKQDRTAFGKIQVLR